MGSVFPDTNSTMRFLNDILNALAEFIRRNPLFTLLVLVLAVGAPALLKGIALFILYFMLTILLLGIALVFWLRWRVRRVQRDMEARMREGGFDTSFDSGAHTPGREGDIRIRRTAETPEKRVSSDVGDYVEFEETRDGKK